MLGLIIACVLPTTWIVDANSGPGTHFTDLPAAIAAAQSGDTILVRPGTYTAFSVSGKALTIRGAGAATTVVRLVSPSLPQSPTVTIANTPSGERFYLSGLTILSNASWIQPAMSATLATVVLADCVVSGDNGTINGSSGMRADTCEVHAHRCVFRGGPGMSSPFSGGGTGAAFSAGSDLAADACSFVGGFGHPHTEGWCYGGPGLTLNASRATIARTNCLGGGAGASFGTAGPAATAYYDSTLRIAGTSSNSCISGTGGLSPSPALWAYSYLPVSSMIVHGPVTLSTPATSGNVTLGAPPLPYLAVTGTLLPSMEMNAAQPVTVDLDGIFPNALYFLKVAYAPDYATTAPWGLGEILVFLPTSDCQIGLLGPTGHLTFTFIPAGVPALLNRPIYSQAATFDAATGQLRLSQSDIRIFAL